MPGCAARKAKGLDWTGLDWTGLDWTGLDWTGRSSGLRLLLAAEIHGHARRGHKAACLLVPATEGVGASASTRTSEVAHCRPGPRAIAGMGLRYRGQPPSRRPLRATARLKGAHMRQIHAGLCHGIRAPARAPGTWARCQWPGRQLRPESAAHARPEPRS
jgi:hypothetical protein